MFCNNCGTQLDDGAAFCPNCGAPAETAPNPAPNATAPYAPAPAAYGQTPAPSADGKPKSSKAKPLIAILACLLAVALIAGAVFTFVFNTPKAVAKKYVKAKLEGNMSASLSCSLLDKKATEKMLKDIAKMADMSIKEYYEELGEYDKKIKNFNDLIKAETKAKKEEMKEEFGKYSVSVKVTDQKKADKEELKELKDKLKNNYKKYITASKIKAAYEFEVEFKIKGKEDDEEDSMFITVVKYGSFWKVSPVSLGILSPSSDDVEYAEIAEAYEDEDDYDDDYDYDDEDYDDSF